MSYLPVGDRTIYREPGIDTVNRNLWYVWEQYERRLYLANTVAAVRGYQIIDNNQTYAAIADADGLVTWTALT